MKKNHIIFALIILLLTGCVSQRRRLVGSTSFEQSTIAPVDTTVIPIFDAAVLYVLAREYENTDDTLRSMAEYVEDRLLELYPKQAYRGMMSKMAEQEGVTEQLKATDQMTWVQKMNSIKHRAEDFIMREYVYGGFEE